MPAFSGCGTDGFGTGDQGLHPFDGDQGLFVTGNKNTEHAGEIRHTAKVEEEQGKVAHRKGAGTHGVPRQQKDEAGSEIDGILKDGVQ